MKDDDGAALDPVGGSGARKPKRWVHVGGPEGPSALRPPRPARSRTAKRLTIIHPSLILLAVLALAAPMTAQERGELGIAVGSTVTSVVVEDLDGNPADLGEYLGERPVLLEFWASWCENCAALQPRMNAAHATWGDRVDFVAIAVAVNQTPRRVRRHIDRDPIPYPMLWDDGGEAVRAFLAPATSYVVVLDEAGTVTYTGIGPDQDIDAAVRTALD